MKRSRFSAEQIIEVLREHETGGASVSELCRWHGLEPLAAGTLPNIC